LRMIALRASAGAEEEIDERQANRARPDYR